MYTATIRILQYAAALMSPHTTEGTLRERALAGKRVSERGHLLAKGSAQRSCKDKDHAFVLLPQAGDIQLLLLGRQPDLQHATIVSSIAS